VAGPELVLELAEGVPLVELEGEVDGLEPGDTGVPAGVWVAGGALI
jgi:hypothetical protein